MQVMEWPIVLTCSLQYWWRTGEWSAMLPFYSLDRGVGAEVDETQSETIGAGCTSGDETVAKMGTRI
jgi:hypothetical protein